MKITSQIAELIGIIIGDGNILYSKEKKYYRLEIVGNVEDDLEYFQHITKIIESKSKNKVKIRIKKERLGQSLRLHINDKKFVEYLINELNLPYGKKTFTITIPEKFLEWKYAKYIIRGICESDGCIYFSKSKVIKYPSYPRIEIRTSSPKLANQLMELLKKQSFNVQIISICNL